MGFSFSRLKVKCLECKSCKVGGVVEEVIVGDVAIRRVEKLKYLGLILQGKGYISEVIVDVSVEEFVCSIVQ